MSKMTQQIHWGKLVKIIEQLQIDQEYLEYTGVEKFFYKNPHKPDQPNWLNQSAEFIEWL